MLLATVVPFGLLTGNTVFEALPTALWSEVWDAVEGTPQVDGRRAYGVVVLLLVAASVSLPRRFWPVFPALLVAGFGATAVLAWHRVVAPGEAFAQADFPPRTWVDDALPAGAKATKLYISPERCPYTELVRHALFLTEFFNESIEHVAGVAGSTSDGLPSDHVTVGPGGRFLLPDGSPLVADRVVTQPELELRGRRIGEGTGANLVLWERREPSRSPTSGSAPARSRRRRAASHVPAGLEAAMTGPGARRIVVVSPHLDDGVLSLGASIASWSRAGTTVELLTVLACEPGSKAPARAAGTGAAVSRRRGRRHAPGAKRIAKPVPRSARSLSGSRSGASTTRGTATTTTCAARSSRRSTGRTPCSSPAIP